MPFCPSIGHVIASLTGDSAAIAKKEGAMSKQDTNSEKSKSTTTGADPDLAESADRPKAPPKEIGGPKGLEPNRYGDWEKGGRAIDF